MNFRLVSEVNLVPVPRFCFFPVPGTILGLAWHPENLLEPSPYFLDLLLFGFGACIGSFLNVVVVRLPPRLFLPISPPNGPAPTLWRPGSRCPVCRTPLHPAHLVPLLSFVCLRGKCGYCRTKISVRYPGVEWSAAVIAVLAGQLVGTGWPLFCALFFLYSLFVLGMMDWDHFILPDVLVLPLLATGLVVNYWGVFCDFTSAAIGAGVGYGVLFGIRAGYRFIRGRDGLGSGDVKLLAAIGAWLGWQSLPVVLFVAASCATLAGLYFIRYRQHSRNARIAFGPHMAAGAFVFFLISC